MAQIPARASMSLVIYPHEARLERMEPTISTNALCLNTALARSPPCNPPEKKETAHVATCLERRSYTISLAANSTQRAPTDSAPTIHAGDRKTTPDRRIVSCCCVLCQFGCFCFSGGRALRRRHETRNPEKFPSPETLHAPRNNIIPFGAPHSDFAMFDNSCFLIFHFLV